MIQNKPKTATQNKIIHVQKEEQGNIIHKLRFN